jgi:glycosyltransferase involved in cell wall biosynthesis
MNDCPITVAYLMSRFPKLTETFVLYEMLELRRLGFEVIVIPLRLEKEGAAHPEVREMKDKIFFTPLFSCRTIEINLKWMLRHPVRYFSTALRAAAGTFGGDIKFFLSSIIYFPKAVVFADTVQCLGVSHVHAHFANHPAIVAWMMHQLCGISYSFTAHGNDLHIDQRMLREKARDATLAVTISDFNIRFIEERCGKETADQFEVIHCGADLSAFKPGRFPKAADHPFEIICVASFQVRKGHGVLIDACAKLMDRGVNFRCRLVGYGECEKLIRKRIRTLNLTEHVILEGAKPKPEVVRLLSEADVLVLTSIETREGRKEGIPVALMEGMASGLPVVSSNLSGIPELVEHGVSGLLFTPGNPEETAAALERLARDPDLRARMGRAARQRVEEAFDLAKNARILAGRIQERLRARA